MRIVKKWTSKSRMEAVREAVRLLKVYQGEEVVAHQHPLHSAIVRLEATVDDRLGRGMRSQNNLLPRARTCWFALLWASRSAAWKVIAPQTLSDVDPFWTIPRHYHPGSDPLLAKRWARLLSQELKSWLKREPEEWKDWFAHLSRLTSRATRLKIKENGRL